MEWQKVSEDRYESGAYVIEASCPTKKKLYWVAGWIGGVGPETVRYLGRKKDLDEARALCDKFEELRKVSAVSVTEGKPISMNI